MKTETYSPTEHLNSLKQKIENSLETVTPLSNTPYNTLLESARYSLLSPGKRIRPLLTLVVTDIYNIQPEKALIPSSAIEMVHCYSLIHDDLPCMDDDAIRRGRPTLHKAFPEWQALLTGNLLLTKAFEILSTAPSLSDKQKLKLIQLLTTHSGDKGIIGGQTMDILAENNSVDIDYLKETHTLKTASLISTSLQFGAIIANAPEEEVSLFNEIGIHLGLAFQIIDDILDITKTSEELGKPANSDIENKKSTYPSLLGYESSKEWVENLHNQTFKLIEKLPYNTLLLKTVVHNLIKRVH